MAAAPTDSWAWGAGDWGGGGSGSSHAGSTVGQAGDDDPGDGHRKWVVLGYENIRPMNNNKFVLTIKYKFVMEFKPHSMIVSPPG